MRGARSEPVLQAAPWGRGLAGASRGHLGQATYGRQGRQAGRQGRQAGRQASTKKGP